jgi:GxxExxY protein
LLESVYEDVLCYRLKKRNLIAIQQKEIPLIFEGVKMQTAFRADIIVEDKVLVELKSIEIIPPVHYKKLVTYLKLSNLHVALLINFYEELLKKGIRRMVYKYEPPL